MKNIFVGADWNIRRLGVTAGVLGGFAIGLAGCETGAGLLGQNAQPDTQLAPTKTAALGARIAVAPVIGAPDAVAKQLAQDFTGSVAQKNIRVASAQDKPDYTLRGYVVAAKDKAGVKVSYIWDVTDPAGQRVNRITGEELVAAAPAGAAPAETWAAVTPQVSQSIGQKSAEQLSTWLLAQSSLRVASATAPAGTGAAVATSVTSVGALPPTTDARPENRTAGVTGAPLAAVVPSLTGAPGDGNSVLARALQTELTKNGVNTTAAANGAYRVEGVVKVGTITDGKQPVQIDWNVKDPQGKRLGTVTQKNEITPGSLDSSWGRTADAAAAAAAQGILKLLPRTTAVN